MRAHYFSGLEIQERYSLRDDSLHHLVHVIRIEVGEKLLLLNGRGLKVFTTVEAISKKELILGYIQHEQVDREYSFDLALGMPKREALELCLKEATELGFRRIYLVRSDYSQMRAPEGERLQKLLISALEQSNAPFFPECIEANWSNIPWSEFSQVLVLDSQRKEGASRLKTGIKGQLLVVGPEGGFSDGESAQWQALDNVKIVNLPTPILRTPTAVATGAGMMLENLLK